MDVVERGVGGCGREDGIVHGRVSGCGEEGGSWVVEREGVDSCG